MKKTSRSPLLALSLLLLAVGCGAANGDPAIGKLEPADVRPALRTLPYDLTLKRIQGPKGNTASFRGRALGPHDTTLEFSIGIGDFPRPVSVRGAGTRHVVWNEEAGFVFNDDGEIARKFETAAQWREVGRMATKVEQSLCKAATGEPCPV
jgi:hypothetical protein